MIRVIDTLGISPDGVDSDAVAQTAPMPATRISRRIDTGTGADRQVAIRSLAEQLLCEANAVIGADRDHLTLIDEIHPDELAFNVAYADRAARVSTTFRDGTAYGRLTGTGFEDEQPRELQDANALPDLLIRLLVGPPTH